MIFCGVQDQAVVMAAEDFQEEEIQNVKACAGPWLNSKIILIVY